VSCWRDPRVSPDIARRRTHQNRPDGRHQDAEGGQPDGYATWTEDQIKQFEDTHPIGSLARLALGCTFTPYREPACPRHGRQRVGRDGLIRIMSAEDGRADRDPILPELQRLLDTVR